MFETVTKSTLPDTWTLRTSNSKKSEVLFIITLKVVYSRSKTILDNELSSPDWGLGVTERIRNKFFFLGLFSTVKEVMSSEKERMVWIQSHFIVSKS